MDFVPEVHATCKIHSSHICMSDGISGVLNVDQCNMEIQSISVAVVQQETISEIVLVRLIRRSAECGTRIP